MRCPFATWLPGPVWKVGYTVFGRTSQKTGVVDHSAEGPLNATLAVLNGPRTASWQFTNDDDLYQHYDIDDVCWHAGYEANRTCVGVENTGTGPLTERQYENLLRLHRWLREQDVLTVCERRVDLWEHNEFMATDCPSGRIPWERLIADLEEAVTKDQFAHLRATEMHLMNLADTAHGITLAAQMRTVSAIRHNEGESPEEEGRQWGCLAKAYRAEIEAIREALKRCSWLGRPG